ncbi:hypothetical protein ASPFODRAFT_212648 [Aspergillus luchuensis CBS 106.47]|uniref:Uncharacterized protein n=1 Tax=Aspergillus luchuensis (strain CBS 106.47) TaxID=1137211 RepID=A0A1M3T0V8_ASPLC|nr:hypothetical protein ASPFODRAFT_212648 [Aspergillus luchuensis CBS 106.47]
MNSPRLPTLVKGFLQEDPEETPSVDETLLANTGLWRLTVTCIPSDDNPRFLTYNGPSVLSPLSDHEDVFRYISTVLPVPINWSVIQIAGSP